MKYDVPLIPQSTNMGCWAASIAMILAWRNSASYDPTLIAANNGGTNYVPSLTSGLNPNDRYILERNGFALEAPQCYMPQAISNRLSSNGPLWVASAVPSPHIRVVTGMEGERLWINDPWPVGSGARYVRTFTQFFGQMENLGAQELDEPAPIYVAYLAA
ncbi:Papain-like cysteine protease AvrRpt2 [Hartmannibacter diazotrophicus]|uniref:Papain-like cysteine protease AvrRpt2 n=1 Tax=Hartmannibacter diazotrophicus TaxID=1482074 RepID=A0A2C9D8U7_9HYPH|nr:papain-like cysteine protease family protein [Hartmannibacter diazotrophicus]SON56590.1 Papain-like cysteine protease AvrRpt2 [Hartmannibacter diazotrophicus]